MKSTFTSAFGLLAFAISINAAAGSEGPGVSVITDNFQVLESGSEVGNAVELGKVGAKTVVKGKKSPDHIAFVRSDDGNNYIIKNKLLVQCANGQNCIPTGVSATEVSAGCYEIVVYNYDQWMAMKDEMSRSIAVRKVAPSYYDGIKPSLK